MITLNYYKQQAEIFANIDLNSSWFSYSIETVEFQGKNCQIYCPLKQSKPYLLIRWIQSIFRSLFGCCCEHPHLKTASALLYVTQQTTQLLGQDASNAELLLKTLQTASSILGKLKPSLSGESWRECKEDIDRTLSRYKDRILPQTLCQLKELNYENCFEIAHSIDWDKDDPVLFNPTYANEICLTVQSFINSSQNLHPHLKLIKNHHLNKFACFLNKLSENTIKDADGSILSQENSNKLRRMILAIMNSLNSLKDTNPDNFRTLYKDNGGLICALSDLLSKNNNNNIDVIFPSLLETLKILNPSVGTAQNSIDWNTDSHALFDPTYVNELVTTIKPFIDSIPKIHPHLKNRKITERDRHKFIHFLDNLIKNKTIRDGYDRPLTKENTDKLRQMILAIMNILNQKKDDPNFEKLYAAIVFQICRALENCSNKINTNIENIFTDLSFPEKGGSAGQKVRLSLQQIRTQLFRPAILDCIKKSDQSVFYLKHEVYTVNYYFRQLASEFGIPPSVSSLDTKSEKGALKNQEENIRAYFKEHYSTALILRKIWEEIHDPYTQSDLPQLFGNWVQEFYKDKDQSNLLYEDGKYKHTIVLEFLENLQIIQNKEPLKIN